MSSNVMVFIKIIDLKSLKYCPLNLKSHLPDIRKELEKHKIINDILTFSKKGNGEEFAEIMRETEEKFQLKDIVEVINKEDSKNYYLYLMKNSSPNWIILNDKCKLDYGRTMSFDGIKKADKKAFTMKDCELTKIGSEGYKKDRLEFESKEDYMKKRNLFINVDDISVKNFVKFGLSIGISQNENFKEEINKTYQYTEIGKVSLKFSKENLKPTTGFINAVNNAIQSENPSEFREITEKYGQFIPTEIILGGRVYFKDTQVLSENSTNKTKEGTMKINIGPSNAIIVNNSSNSKKKSNYYSSDCMRILGGTHPDDKNFHEKVWIESLKDYQNWDCIEYKNPISIFQLLPDELYKKSYKSFGKRILYTSTEDCDYDLHEAGMCRIFELNKIPPHISKIIQSKDVDCDIFASVIDTKNSKNVFFNCQIFRASEPEEKPCIIIHGIQKEFKQCKYKLSIKIIVVGYDTDFLSNFSVELIKKEYIPQSQEFGSMILQDVRCRLIEQNIPFFGIPIISNLNSSNNSENSLIIGHNFRKLDNNLKIDVFSYCSKTNCYVKLPRITFCTLIILNNHTSSTYELLPFEFSRINIFRKKPFINLNSKGFTSKPKCISLCLSRDDDYNPIFFNQKSTQIKVKYVDCKCKKTCSICRHKKLKISDEDNAICIVFEGNQVL
ncbi:hypothetical protein C1645_488884 [Glomus cerebriforme]|uniref:Uncharacterized protein n=1 Tax=Glomus cerebriforme TaxID=658196 RepID=A0A397TG68_9GLOM|nr:hypothetical protein C1645_488884 [Glomus cerebriforme]